MNQLFNYMTLGIYEDNLITVNCKIPKMSKHILI